MLLSLQLYTVRDAARANLQQTLQRIAQIGFCAIEVARLPLTQSTLDNLLHAQDTYGLTVHSFQLKYKQLANTDYTIPFLQRAGCRVAVVAVLPTTLMNATEKALVQFYSKLNRLGKIYSRAGITLAYHHHDFEAMSFGAYNGFTILEQVLDPEYVKLVCDTYWLQKSGYCPQDFIVRHCGAIAGVHARDYTVRRTALLPFSADCPLGDGVLDFSAIIMAARQAGVGYFAVEQNSRRPFDDISKSMEYLKTFKW